MGHNRSNTSDHVRFKHYALSALGICQRILPGPMAQAIIFRAFGAALLRFYTTSLSLGTKRAVGFESLINGAVLAPLFLTQA
jgi:hypothetical protein